MEPKRISARDRRFAAVHEAGHVVVGHHIGRKFKCATPEAMIMRNKEPLPGESTWEGKTDIKNIERLPELERRIIAFAGAVAVCLWRGKDPDVTFWADPDFGGMSSTDWDLAQCEPGKPDLICSVAVLRLARLLRREGRLWGKLIREARTLIVAQRSSAQGQRR